MSDLFAPVSGKVTRVNDALVDTPELINDDCWEKGWMIAIEGAAGADLLDPAAYGTFLESAGH